MIDYLASAVWGGASYRITQPWGVTSLLVEPYWKQAQAHWHCGIDIAVTDGTPLFAARAGRVASVGWGQLGIDVAAAPVPEVDWYIHVDHSIVSVGQRVDAGQLVAYSGNKVPAGGVTYGPHLHFEVQSARPPTYNVPATSLDPIPVLTRTFSQGSGSLGDEHLDLTNPVDKTVYDAAKQTEIIHQGLFGVDPSVLQPPIQDRLLAIQTALGKISAPVAASVDLSGIQASLTALHAKLDSQAITIAGIKAKVDKDLA